MPSDTARRLHREHLARLQRMAARRKPDAGIAMHNGRPVAAEIHRLAPYGGLVAGHFMRRWQFPFAAGIFKLGISMGYLHSISLDQIVRVVCEYYEIPRVALISPRRYARLTRARQVAMYLARELTALSFPQIARVLGDRDHTTAMHGARAIAQQLERDTDLAGDIQALKYRLGVA